LIAVRIILYRSVIINTENWYTGR